MCYILHDIERNLCHRQEMDELVVRLQWIELLALDSIFLPVIEHPIPQTEQKDFLLIQKGGPDLRKCTRFRTPLQPGLLLLALCCLDVSTPCQVVPE